MDFKTATALDCFIFEKLHNFMAIFKNNKFTKRQLRSEKLAQQKTLTVSDHVKKIMLVALKNIFWRKINNK